MAWDLGSLGWTIVAAIAGGLTLVAVTRPWRFFRLRALCPRCKQMLPRWGRWGWKDDWTCSRCGCVIGR